MEARRVKEENKAIVVHIQYNVNGDEDYYFETYRDVPLRRIFLDFCDRLDLVYRSINFRFDGIKIKETQTADDLGLVNGDIIDAFCHVDGGYGPPSTTSIHHL